MLQLKGYGLNCCFSKELHLHIVKWSYKVYFEGNVIPHWIMFTGEDISRPEAALFTYHTQEVDVLDGDIRKVLFLVGGGDKQNEDPNNCIYNFLPIHGLVFRMQRCELASEGKLKGWEMLWLWSNKRFSLFVCKILFRHNSCFSKHWTLPQLVNTQWTCVDTSGHFIFELTERNMQGNKTLSGSSVKYWWPSY